MCWTSVDFPEAVAPMIPTTSPAEIVKDTSVSAGTSSGVPRA